MIAPKKYSLAEVRLAIDEADDIILKALAARMRAAKYLKILKKEEGIAVEDPTREKEVKARWKKRAQELDLPIELPLLLLDILLAESKSIQRES